MAAEAHFIETIIGIGILLFAAKLMAELFLRLKLPIVLGELLAGMIVGPFALGAFFVIDGKQLLQINDEIRILGEMGAIVILFMAGLEMTPKEYKALATDPVTTRVILPNAAGNMAKDATDTAGNIGAFVTTGGTVNVAKKVSGAGERISTEVGNKVKEFLKPKTIKPFLEPRDYESLGQTTTKLSKNVADRFGLDTEKAKQYADTVQDFFKTKSYDL